MRENLRLFLPTHIERHESIMKKKIREFILGYKSLEQFLSLETNADERWYEITDKSNTEVVDQISKLLKETYSIKLKG
jgi:hypothetical protein